MQGRRRREPRAAAVPQRHLGPRKPIQEASTEGSHTSDPYLPIKALGGPRGSALFLIGSQTLNPNPCSLSNNPNKINWGN